MGSSADRPSVRATSTRVQTACRHLLDGPVSRMSGVRGRSHPDREPAMRLPTLAVTVVGLALTAATAQPPADRPVGPKSWPRLKVMTFNVRYSAANDGENGWERR